MKGINLPRVMLGGLLTGLVINLGEIVFNTVLIFERLQAEVTALNAPRIGAGGATAFVVINVALGTAAVWLYAAMRPRFGPGTTTAAFAGATAWGLSYMYMAATCIALGVFPGDLLIMGAAWGLPEIVVGTIAGASVYQEQAMLH